MWSVQGTMSMKFAVCSEVEIGESPYVLHRSILTCATDTHVHYLGHLWLKALDLYRLAVYVRAVLPVLGDRGEKYG